MTVYELIERLKTFPPNRVVVLSADEEGNNYAELEVVEDTDARRITLYPSGDAAQDIADIA